MSQDSPGQPKVPRVQRMQTHANLSSAQAAQGKKIEEVKSPPRLLIWLFGINISRGEKGIGGELQGAKGYIF